MRTSLGLGWWAARAPTWQRCAPSFRRGALSSRSAAALLLVLLHQCMLASLRCTAAAPDKTSNTGLHQLSTSLFIAALSRANLSHMHPTRRVQAPASIALPFGTFERVLGADCNRAVAAAVAAEERSAVSEMEGWGQVTNNAMHMPHRRARRSAQQHACARLGAEPSLPDWGPNRACLYSAVRSAADGTAEHVPQLPAALLLLPPLPWQAGAAAGTEVPPALAALRSTIAGKPPAHGILGWGSACFACLLRAATQLCMSGTSSAPRGVRSSRLPPWGNRSWVLS